MRKTIHIWLLVLVAFISVSFGQDTNQQWEYLVVYENGNVNLNELGRKSWELVSLTFNEGQPVRFFFKRPYIPERTRLEAEQAKNAEKKPSKVDFIELDQADFDNTVKETADKIKSKFEQALKNSGVKFEILEFSTRNKQIYSKISVDGSSDLLQDGNKYRLSKAKIYLRQIATEIFEKSGMTRVSPTAEFYYEVYPVIDRGNTTILISLILNNGEAKKIVKTGYITGNWTNPE